MIFEQKILGGMAALALVAGLLALGGGQTALAMTDCSFTTVGTTMTLDGDCTTDETILIPAGFTLDGDGNTITAVDPGADHFRGAVVTNDGSEAHVTNLGITTSGLANACDGGADRLRGILFDGAGGSITNNTVTDINQGMSGCQEGNAIEIRNAPFDGTHPDTKTAEIAGNTITDFQKSGIVANGDVSANVYHNTITGLGPVDFIAQNGIQVGFGATGSVTNNQVSESIFTPQTFGSGGILLFAGGDGIVIEKNEVNSTDVGIWLAGADSATVSRNHATNSTFDGIALDDQGGSVEGNTVRRNDSENNDTGIGLSGANDNVVEKNTATSNTSAGIFVGFESTGNTIKRNKAKKNDGDGILVEADSNTIKRNKAEKNGGVGIATDGDGNTIKGNKAKKNASDIQNSGNNTYKKNKCNSSSGPPVDCGASPLVPHGTVGVSPLVRPFE